MLFLCLNSEDPPASRMSDAQVAYVEKALAENRDVRWTLVFLHKPLWVYNNPENNWGRIEELLKGRPHTVYAGHTHNYHKHVRNEGEQYIVLATMGGGSRLRGANFGEFDHFMWVTMTDQGPRMANLMLSGIWDTNIISDERLELIRPLITGAAVRTDGIVVDSEMFTGAKTKLRLTNDADVPMHVALSIVPEETVHASVRRIEETIEPNMVELIDLELTSVGEVAVADVPPLRVDWTATYHVPGHVQPVRARGTHRIVIDNVFELAAVRRITVDGGLDDWRELPLWGGEPGQIADEHSGEWFGAQDASARFGVGVDRDYLYIGVRTMDDQVRVNPRTRFDRQDSVELRIDATPENGADDALRIVVLPGIVPADVDSRAGVPALPEGAIVVSKQLEAGHETEIAIPVALLGETEDIRINVGVHDNDADGQVAAWWRPAWGSPADYDRSGRFVR